MLAMYGSTALELALSPLFVGWSKMRFLANGLTQYRPREKGVFLMIFLGVWKHLKNGVFGKKGVKNLLLGTFISVGFPRLQPEVYEFSTPLFKTYTPPLLMIFCQFIPINIYFSMGGPKWPKRGFKVWGGYLFLDTPKTSFFDIFGQKGGFTKSGGVIKMGGV
jgi:hypothetical protein